MGHGIEKEVCQGTGSGVGVRNPGKKWCAKVHRGVQKGAWAWSLGEGQVGQSGCTYMCKGWNGGSRVWWVPSTPPIGKMVPLGLVCGEKSSK